jgi:hypothetical protein
VDYSGVGWSPLYIELAGPHLTAILRWAGRGGLLPSADGSGFRPPSFVKAAVSVRLEPLDETQLWSALILGEFEVLRREQA